jgi:hypothetical protein
MPARIEVLSIGLLGSLSSLSGVFYTFFRQDFRCRWRRQGGIVRPEGLSRLLGASALRGCWVLAGMDGAKKAGGGRLDIHRPIRTLRSGSAYELTCHPGLPPEEPDLRAWDYRHATELQALTSPSVRAENTAAIFN